MYLLTKTHRELSFCSNPEGLVMAHQLFICEQYYSSSSVHLCAMGDSVDISGVLTAFGAVFLTNTGEH